MGQVQEEPRQSEEKSSVSTDSAISIGADSSSTSSIDDDTYKVSSSSAAEVAGSTEPASQPRASTFRQPRHSYQHQRVQSHMRYDQQQLQVNLTGGAPFGTLYAPPPPPGAPLAALHRPPLAYASSALFYEPPEAISMGHHHMHPSGYCEPTQPAPAVYTAAANAVPINLSLLDQSLLMTQYGRPPPQPPEAHAIYYYTTVNQQPQRPFAPNYNRKPPVGDIELAPVSAVCSFDHHQQQATAPATSTCCCHQQQQQQHEPPLQAAAPPKSGAIIDEGDARQSPDAGRDSRDAASGDGGGGGKTSPATTTRDADLNDAQNLTQDLTSPPPPPEQQQPSAGGCLGKPAPEHSPPSATDASSPSSSSHRAAHMGHQRDQQEASRPFYRQPNGPTYYHHLLPNRPATHHNQQYYNNTTIQQEQYNNLAAQQQYLVAGRQYMPPHLYGQLPQFHSHHHHQLHLTTNYPTHQQSRQVVLLPPPQAALNYQHLSTYHQLFGHQLLHPTYAPQHHHATPPPPPPPMHPNATYYHQDQAYTCHLATMRSQPPHLVPTNYHQLPASWPQPPAQQINHYVQQHQPALASNTTAEASQTLSCKYKPDVNTLLLFKQAQTWAATLPIDYEPTKTRQAYGMDKVWRDEFEQLFSQLSSDVGWTLVEVETNPSLRDSACIVGYRGRYLIQLEADDQNQVVEVKEEGEGSLCNETIDSVSDKDSDSANESTGSKDNLSCRAADKSSKAEPDELEADEREQETESDCDSGTQVNSTSGFSSNSPLQSLVGGNNTINPPESSANLGEDETQEQPLVNNSLSPQPAPVTTTRPFSTRFRMFIDSAKVRFCCDHCGHGWTSMKGRVVFWYELFELLPKSMLPATEKVEDGDREESASDHQVEEEKGVDDDESHLVGYCAYKLFGQQCDVCKIEGRFERPMWYPEEVTKVLNNLYNKIGQVYFGFKMPTIDKQRRAGKPKTSHNSSLCQACYDGVCTDRK